MTATPASDSPSGLQNWSTRRRVSQDMAAARSRRVKKLRIAMPAAAAGGAERGLLRDGEGDLDDLFALDFFCLAIGLQVEKLLQDEKLLFVLQLYASARLKTVFHP